MKSIVFRDAKRIHLLVREVKNTSKILVANL